ncbi:MAG: Crp/Fnr family transcriptional regulator [Anaerolineae bacterium]
MNSNDLRLFSGLSPAEEAHIREHGRRRAVERGAFLVHQGDPATSIFYMDEGRAKLGQVTPEGQEVTFRYLGPGDTFGAIAVTPGTVYPVSVEAVERCVVLTWDRDTMQQLMAANGKFALNLTTILTTMVRQLQDQVRELATERAERRIARALTRLARQMGRRVENGILIDMPLSRQDLAELTGTTLYTVSRVLSQWEQQGIVESGRERILLRVPHRLVLIADDLTPPTKE